MENDMFQYCIYCGCDCHESPPEHRDDCPQTTGVYPITEFETDHQIVCTECREPFKTGDSYCHQAVEGETDIVSVVCVGCAILYPSRP